MASLERLKVTGLPWDSEKDPNGGIRWMDTISSVVSSIKHGDELEEFLDEKLGRNVAKTTTVPSSISSDPDFDLAAAPAAATTTTSTSSAPATAPAVSVSTTGSGTTATSGTTAGVTASGSSTIPGSMLRQAVKPYHMLSAGAKELDDTRGGTDGENALRLGPRRGPRRGRRHPRRRRARGRRGVPQERRRGRGPGGPQNGSMGGSMSLAVIPLPRATKRDHAVVVVVVVRVMRPEQEQSRRAQNREDHEGLGHGLDAHLSRARGDFSSDSTCHDAIDPESFATLSGTDRHAHGTPQ